MRVKENPGYSKMFDKLSDKSDLFSAVLLMALVFIVLIEIAARYFFNSPFTFTYDLTSLLFPWIVFLSMISVTHHKEHIGLVFLKNKLPKRLKNISSIINDFLESSFIAFMFIGTIKLSIAVSNQMIGNLYMSKAFYYLPLDVAFAIILYMKINEIIGILKRKRKPTLLAEVNQEQDINSSHIEQEGDAK